MSLLTDLWLMLIIRQQFVPGLAMGMGGRRRGMLSALGLLTPGGHSPVPQRDFWKMALENGLRNLLSVTSGQCSGSGEMALRPHCSCRHSYPCAPQRCAAGLFSGQDQPSRKEGGNSRSCAAGKVKDAFFSVIKRVKVYMFSMRGKRVVARRENEQE